ncbi:hypothetical protein EVAR_58501_1 [Eumeta japonica]|uniref:Uncharacterized protein n=1 Tax=Eumeta variegata TaxID=151549 RepID=A0A4C1Z868_EUMVA|nr:hypothetical protein EVAR_58501_1 [Eumeta japonica]
MPKSATDADVAQADCRGNALLYYYLFIVLHRAEESQASEEEMDGPHQNDSWSSVDQARTGQITVEITIGGLCQEAHRD